MSARESWAGQLATDRPAHKMIRDAAGSWKTVCGRGRTRPARDWAAVPLVTCGTCLALARSLQRLERRLAPR